MNISAATKQMLCLLLCTAFLYVLIPLSAASASGVETPAGFADLKKALSSQNDGTNLGLQGDGAPFAKEGDATQYFGYSWNAGKGWWNIEAWNETVDGTTVRNIKLNADVRNDATDTIIMKGTVTLDLNGHTISGTGSYVLGIPSGAAVTVRDTSSGRTGSIIGTTMVINDQGTFNLESGTVRATSPSGYAVYVTAAGSLTTSGDISSNFIGIRTKSPHTTITGGTVSAAQRGIHIDKGGSVTVTGGEISGSSYGICAFGDVQMDGGTIKSNFYGIYVQSGSVTVNGGTVDASAGKYGVYTYNKASFHMSGGEIQGGSEAGVCIYWGGTHTVSGGTITGLFAVTVWGYQELDDQKELTGSEPYGKTELTVSGGRIEGYYHGISGNARRDNGYSRGGTIINITGSAVILGKNGVGIYHPQIGELNISGGSITGITGVEMRGGDLTMTGGSVTGAGAPLKGSPNGNGPTTEGAGIAVSQHVERRAINVAISGGTITGYTSFYENAYQGNEEEALQKVKFKITGGHFKCHDVSSALPVNRSSAFSAHNSENEYPFITGGMFAQPVGSYGTTINHIGSLSQQEMKSMGISSTIHPYPSTGQLHCFKVADDDLSYQVGYLTGVGSSIEMYAGQTLLNPLVPTYSLNGTGVGNVYAAVLVEAGDVNQITSWQEKPVITKWESADATVATVDENGIVTAVKASPQPVNIIATLLNGEKVFFPVTVKQFTVTFDMNGHGAQVASQGVAYGGVAAEPAPAPSEADWTFGGWYTDPACMQPFDFTTPITRDITLYAKWTVNAYTVTFDMNGHGAQIAPRIVAEGGKVARPADPIASGYAFSGWYIDAALTMPFDFGTAIHANVPLYARWATIPQTGDHTHVFLWIALLAVSGRIIAGTLALQKKQKR